jgi:GNAT superfamily N-acetyltransferase
VAIEVRPARKLDIPALALVLGRAFYDDPVLSWVQPDPERRRTATPGLFGAMARHHFLASRGAEIAVDPKTGVGAAALWDPPGWRPHTAAEQLAMLPAVLRAFRGRLAAGRAVSDLMKANHPEAPHWYLAVLGSAPSVRGKGFAHALLESRLAQCDAEFAPAYLESSNPMNIPYYERFGFVVTGELKLPDAGPSLWPMWRAPR